MPTHRQHASLASLPVLALGALVLVVVASGARASPFYSSARKAELRAMAEETWRHAYGSYKRVAYPADELLPLSCDKQGHDRRNPDILNDRPGFEQAIREVITHVSFDVNSRVQVFEVTIRMLGGLLSGHLLASPTPPYSSIRGFALDWYRGELLDLAVDLGRRLMPAFATPTGIPFARVHLQRGLKGKGGKGESGETCAAGASSLLLEFITLSRLSGDPSFEAAAKKAFFAIWSARSDVGLLGNTIDARSGKWMHAVSGIGAGIDSFFEYAAKAYVLTGEEQYLRVWDESYAALQRYVRSPDGFLYRNVNQQTGQLSSVLIDSLSAFFPGVQTLMGDLDGAAKSHAPFAFLWRRFGGLPELYNTHSRVAAHLGYPLRPEYVESNMYLYQATKDDHYLELAEQILLDINARARVDCGFAAVKNLETGELEDKMPSFVTAETLKYLYLTFDETSPFLTSDSSFVFTTEGHPLEIPHSPRPTPFRNRKKRIFSPPPPADSSSPAAAGPTCAAHQPLFDQRYQHFLKLSMEHRTDWEQARYLAGYEPEDELKEVEEGRWDANGWCEVVKGEDPVATANRATANRALFQSFVMSHLRAHSSLPNPSSAASDVGIELLFAPSTALEVTSPSSSQLTRSAHKNGDLVVHSINGLRFSLVRAPTGAEGYVVAQIGPHKVAPGRSVVIRDPAVLASVPPRKAEKLSLWAEVAPKGRPPPRWKDVREEEPKTLGKLEALLDRLMHPLSGSSPPPTEEDRQCGGQHGETEDEDQPFYDDPTLPLDPSNPPLELHIPALAASFGPSLASHAAEALSPFTLDGEPLPLLLPPFSPYGSQPSAPAPRDPIPPHLLLLRRGHCSFALKSHFAALSGASGVVLVSSPTELDNDPTGEGFIVPSAEAADEAEETMKALVPLVLVGNATGARLEAMARRAGEGNVRLPLEGHEERVGESEEQQVFVAVHRADDEEDEGEQAAGMVLGGYVVRNIKLPGRR
ncbi:hypothetical protein JCM10213v2_008805 [Rhodosporidiobolus nylandii]